MEEIFLVDGSSVFFRAFHGIPNLRRSDGMATNAIYGYVMTLKSILNEYNPQKLVVAFDRREKTFRNELYSAYKANRVEPPEELLVQIPYIKKITSLLGISQIELAGYEADDLIGTLALMLSKEKAKVVIVSGDKDLLQLVNDSVSVLRLTPNKNIPYADGDVRERYGVPPEQLVEVLALMGDSSDNVPGVPGIGEKTAISLIQQYGTLEQLYENVDLISGNKRRENLKNHKEMAFLSRALCTIKTDVSLELETDFFSISPRDETALYTLYEELEFRSFAQELNKTNTVEEKKDYRTVATAEGLKEAVQEIRKQKRCAFDTETTSLDSLRARVVGISLTIQDNQGWYVPLRHTGAGNLPMDRALPLLKEVFESDTIEKAAHNVKYDLQVLKNEGIHLNGVKDDTLIASYLVYPEYDSHKLDDLAFRLFGMKMTPIADLIGKGRKQICMTEVDIGQASDYACEDTEATWRLWSILPSKIRENELDYLYRQIELPVLFVLAEMERRGIKVDPVVLAEQSFELGKELDSLASEVYHSVGKEFNLNSPLQLSKILYDDLQLLTGRTRSTRADILEKLAADGVPIAQQILDYRHRQKIKSTYLDALQKLIRPETGRVHTTYNQAVASTGRISSSDPNLQNIPIRTDLGRRVRRAFVAEDGYQLISLDYSQIELRILAHISNDPGLLSAFSAGEDIHKRTAVEVFGVSIDEVTADMRRKAKEINFGLNYGMSPYGLAKRLNIDDQEAASYIERYFARYPRVREYMDQTVTSAKRDLYVTTMIKRRIMTAGIRDTNKTRQENAKRAAINAPIQGSAADLLKKAMLLVHQELRPLQDVASILLTVHDELVLEVKEDRVEEICELCRNQMEHAVELAVPTPVEWSVGDSWADLK